MTGTGVPGGAPGGQQDELAGKPFDELVAELQRIVGALEAGNLPLEETIGLYAEGLRVHAACEERLRTAELRITEIGRQAGAQAGADSRTGESRSGA